MNAEELVSRLEQMTASLLQGLDEASYERLSEFVDERGIIVDELSRIAMEDSERLALQSRIRNVLQCDEVISSRMKEYMEEAARERQKLAVQKTTVGAYENFGNGDNSVFFDRKK
ncbi:flagellar protein FliT [Paenibacillus sp.]|uniref:flagellar protein FliT n=1 Tax=Paenibacillus sp. TaxID=58172 RepID=UPI002D758EED|nr:flagellar protein FliT [Paenibacillus sp.]HZG87407.1 flagellar protein FliT [Paenibacillus sp.]